MNCRRYLLLCYVIISICFLDPIDGHEAIVGGTKAKARDFQYFVSIEVNNESACGGGIIGDRFVLTAAHCILSRFGNFLGNQMAILAGTKDEQKKGLPALFIRVNKLYVPMEYNPLSVNTTGDIAVLRLVRPLELSKNKHLRRLDLPKSKNDNYVGKSAEISGFGWDWVKIANGNHEIGGNRDTMLRYVMANVLRNEVCQKCYKCRAISEKRICARTRSRKRHNSNTYGGVCAGDSGGPLVLNNTVIGILVVSPFGCSEQLVPAIYTRVSHYLLFIKSAMYDQYQRDIRTLELHSSKIEHAKENLSSLS